jgi:hypothetical protein
VKKARGSGRTSNGLRGTNGGKKKPHVKGARRGLVFLFSFAALLFLLFLL